MDLFALYGFVMGVGSLLLGLGIVFVFALDFVCLLVCLVFCKCCFRGFACRLLYFVVLNLGLLFLVSAFVNFAC